MASQDAAVAAEGAWKAEIEAIQQGLLITFLPVIALLAWFWFGLSIVEGWDLQVNVPPVTGILAVLFLAYRLRSRYYTLACWLLVLSMVAGNSLFIASHPSTSAVAFGVLTVFAASALLGPSQAALVAVLAWLANLAAAAQPGLLAPLDLLLLYLLTALVAWLGARPLRTSVQVALAGWTRARDAVREVRARRAELYRVMRALEEATARIERMNEELLAQSREAEAARAQKARFVATVSHELRGPLNLILGFSRLMALSPEHYGEPLPSAYHADVDAIYRSSQHLAALIDDVLDLSQVEADRVALVKDRIDLEEDVVKKAAAIVKPLAERKGLQLDLKLAGGLPWILADSVRLRQALLNILTNAVRYTEQGVITVRTSHQEDRLLVSVQDTGPGIPPEEMPRLFQEFRQLRHTATREGRGSGLGLAISKQFIDLHGGEIWAESRVGVGTTFNFTVPLPGMRALSSPVFRTEGPCRAPESGRSCLVVHSDPQVIRLLARYLEGYRIVGVPDPQEVPLLTEELHPHAILTSPAQVEQVRAQLAGLSFDVTVIACGLPGAGKAGALGGILTHLVKPIRPEMVAAVMRQVEREGETNILLVDDDPDAVRLLQSMLTSLPRPYNILRAYSGPQALEHTRSIVPDVAFVDLVMPEIDGRETIRRMRADRRLQGVPVVIISAEDSSEEALAVDFPITAYRSDPMDIARASACLRALLDGLSPRYLPAGVPPEPPRAAQPG